MDFDLLFLRQRLINTHHLSILRHTLKTINQTMMASPLANVCNLAVPCFYKYLLTLIKFQKGFLFFALQFLNYLYNRVVTPLKLDRFWNEPCGFFYQPRQVF